MNRLSDRSLFQGLKCQLLIGIGFFFFFFLFETSNENSPSVCLLKNLSPVIEPVSVAGLIFLLLLLSWSL